MRDKETPSNVYQTNFKQESSTSHSSTPHGILNDKEIELNRSVTSRAITHYILKSNGRFTLISDIVGEN